MLSKYIFYIVEAIQADTDLQVVCLVSVLGLSLSMAVLPHTKEQLRTRPLLYANARGGN